jgi:hypothetical protein
VGVYGLMHTIDKVVVTLVLLSMHKLVYSTAFMLLHFIVVQHIVLPVYLLNFDICEIGYRVILNILYNFETKKAGKTISEQEFIGVQRHYLATLTTTPF